MSKVTRVRAADEMWRAASDEGMLDVTGHGSAEQKLVLNALGEFIESRPTAKQTLAVAEVITAIGRWAKA